MQNNFKLAAPTFGLTNYIKSTQPLQSNMLPVCSTNQNTTLNKPEQSSADYSILSDPKYNHKHKSCPVSPLNEEIGLSSLDYTLGVSDGYKYSENAKIILNTIHMNTEKIVNEISEKHKDLNKYKINESKVHENKGNEDFSSDSLEDCSLTSDFFGKKCKKHSKNQSSFNFRLKEEHRKVSLSEILYEVKYNEHRSATIHNFNDITLYGNNKISQESIYSDTNRSCYDSMESILSDDSECKSAPMIDTSESNNPRNEFAKLETNASKSYGSSPNKDSFLEKEYNNCMKYFTNDVCNSLLPLSLTCPELSKEVIDVDSSDVSNFEITNKINQYVQEENFHIELSAYSYNIHDHQSVKKSASLNCVKEKYNQNFARFENDRLLEYYRKLSTLESDYIAHKPPVAHRKSQKNRNRTNKFAKKANKFNDNVYPEQPKEAMYCRFYLKERLFAQNHYVQLPEENTLDSNTQNCLDPPERDIAPKIQKNVKPECPEYVKFMDIEKKIAIINKLVELEEKRLEREKTWKELRMMPFHCDSRKKGYVKSLSKNFDELSNLNLQDKLSGSLKGKRNYSMPDVLEGHEGAII